MLIIFFFLLFAIVFLLFDEIVYHLESSPWVITIYINNSKNKSTKLNLI